jgi:hypothetical protein
MVMVMMVVVMPTGGENRACKHRKQERDNQKLLHGQILARFQLRNVYRKGQASREERGPAAQAHSAGKRKLEIR